MVERWIERVKEAKKRAEVATEEEAVELSLKVDHYIKQILRELPSLRCHNSKLNIDIIIWDDAD